MNVRSGISELRPPVAPWSSQANCSGSVSSINWCRFFSSRSFSITCNKTFTRIICHDICRYLLTNNWGKWQPPCRAATIITAVCTIVKIKYNVRRKNTKPSDCNRKSHSVSMQLLIAENGKSVRETIIYLSTGLRYSCHRMSHAADIPTDYQVTHLTHFW